MMLYILQDKQRCVQVSIYQIKLKITLRSSYTSLMHLPLKKTKQNKTKNLSCELNFCRYGVRFKCDFQ